MQAKLSKKGLGIVSLTFSLCLVLTAAAQAQVAESIRWENDFDKASALARETNRLLLVHFYGGNCPPCKLMDVNVFANQTVVAELNRNFVMMKADMAVHGALAKKLNASLMPTDVALKPNGQVMHRREGYIVPERFLAYLAFLRKQANIGDPTPGRGRTPSEALYAGSPVVHAPAFQPVAPQQPFTATPVRQEHQAIQSVPASASAPAQNIAAASEVHGLQDPFTKQPVAASAQPAVPVGMHAERGNPVRSPGPEPAPALSVDVESNLFQTAESAAPTVPAATTIELPLGMEGYCPVVLCDEERWVSGNPAYFAMFQGKVYRFSDEAAMTRFVQTPLKYAPVAMGEDIVLMVDRNKKSVGLRKYGVWFQDRVYLFSSQQTLDAFAARPEHYAEIARQYESARNKVFDAVQR